MAGRMVYSAGFGRSLPRDSYYGFLEARDTSVTPPEPIARDGWPVGFRWSRPTATLLAFSAVPASKFIELSTGFRPPPVRPSAVWRTDRRDQLLELFAKLTVHRVEIYTPENAPQELGTAFRPGGWFKLGLSEVTNLVDPAAGWLSRADEDAGRAISLARFRRLSPPLRDRLRRVFSLDHIGDLGSDAPGGGEPTPTPPKAPPLIRPAPGRPKQYAVTVFGAERLKGDDRDRVRETFQAPAPRQSVKARPRVRLRIGGPS